MREEILDALDPDTSIDLEELEIIEEDLEECLL